MMVAAVSPSTTNDLKSTQDDDENSTRTPLLPSEKDNKSGFSTNFAKRPKSRTVSSRYMSPSASASTSVKSLSSSSSRRFPSPLVPRNTTPASNTASLAPKRAVSVDRRRAGAARPLTPDLDTNAGEISVSAAKQLVTSMRRLSVSFQGEAFSLPVSKTKAAPSSPSVRKGTPERRRTSTPSRGGVGDQVEPLNSKSIDQHRWPGRNRLVTPLSKSLDYSGTGAERSQIIGSGHVIRALQQSMVDERRGSFDGSLNLDFGNPEFLKPVQWTPDGNLVNHESSDTESVSSGSSVQESGGALVGRSLPRGIGVSARFWQETNTRLRRLQDSSSPLSASPASKLFVPSKLKKYPSDVPMSSPRTMASPIRSASPSKLVSRGTSPSRIRNAVSTIKNNFNESPSVLSFAVDVRRGKVGENKIIDAHLLRLLYNRHLQLLFVNARSEAVLLVQKHSAEKDLWNAWITISDLRDTVTRKRHRLQLLRQKLKLASILKGHIAFLEDWAFLDKDHSISLIGAIEALKASTLRLPVVGGAIADIRSLKDAIGSAIDVMETLVSLICSVLLRVEEVNSLVTELVKVAAKERVLLAKCTDCISKLAAIQVKDSSLRTHILQHSRLPTA